MSIKRILCSVFVIFVCGCTQKPNIEIEQQLKEKAIVLCEAVVNEEYQTIIDQGNLSIRYEVTPEMMKESLQTFPDTYGDFVNIGSCYIMIQQGFYIACVDVNYENYKHVFQIVFDNNVRVVAISVK